MIRLMVLFSLLAWSVSAWCVEPSSAKVEVLTLDKALEVAMRNNIKVQNAGLEVGKAEDDIAAARTRRG